MNKNVDARRSLPSVDKLLQVEPLRTLCKSYGRRLVVDVTRQVLDEARQRITDNLDRPADNEIIHLIEERLASLTAPTLIPVINASGVIIHTNLGRAPLSRDALQAGLEVACQYSNLEYDLQVGKRGSRYLHAEKFLCQICGAEAALVVNNNAAAVLLSLAALANRQRVVIARSQLVEIGGGFRIPDVMRQSGAKLVEIGTTNRVNLDDYRATLDQKPALFLVAHRSNFKIVGFTAEPSIGEIAKIAQEAGIFLVVDLGSGALLDTADYGLAHEPMVQEALQDGADLVCFSGDKLLGGPQAGILVGRKSLIEKLRCHPLARAVRADKIALSALSATLLHYIKNEAVQKVPVWQMISQPLEEILRRAQRWKDQLAQRGIQSTIIEGASAVGGGSLPGESLPTYLLAIPTRKPEDFLRKLRHNSPPIIARIEQDAIVFDPRTVFEEQVSDLLIAIETLRGHIK